MLLQNFPLRNCELDSAAVAFFLSGGILMKSELYSFIKENQLRSAADPFTGVMIAAICGSPEFEGAVISYKAESVGFPPF